MFHCSSANKGYLRLEGKKKRRAYYVLKGLHQLCESLAHLSPYPERAGAPVDGSVHFNVQVKTSPLSKLAINKSVPKTPW